jgi:hypothetical protein
MRSLWAVSVAFKGGAARAAKLGLRRRSQIAAKRPRHDGARRNKGRSALKPFIRIGTYYLNVNHIVYAESGTAGLRIVTTSEREDGTPYAIIVKGADADTVRKALEPFVAFTVEATSES